MADRHNPVMAAQDPGRVICVKNDRFIAHDTINDDFMESYIGNHSREISDCTHNIVNFIITPRITRMVYLLKRFSL